MRDENNVADLAGLHYVGVLKTLHDALRPKSYFEIGTLHGDTLALANCSSVAVDPCFAFDDVLKFKRVVNKSKTLLFQMTADEFFAQNSLTELLGGCVDLAFLDGMHRCEFLLRDFMRTEKYCRINSIIALHDCLPVEEPMTSRMPFSGVAIQANREGWWTGDVWRTALLLKRRRPDLVITALDAAATGLMLITNLNPQSTVLADGYSGHVSEMLSWSLSDLTISRYFAEIGVESTQNLATNEQITGRFWL